jgi:hypothetical protein
MEKQFRIRCVNPDIDGEYLLWSNEQGWVDEGYPPDVFSEEERRTLNLPLEGRWEETTK